MRSTKKKRKRESAAQPQYWRRIAPPNRWLNSPERPKLCHISMIAACFNVLTAFLSERSFLDVWEENSVSVQQQRVH